MGKEETESSSTLVDPASSVPASFCCTKASCKWTIPVVLGVYGLLFAFWSVGSQRRNDNDSHTVSPSAWIPYVEASFRLHTTVFQIHESLAQLQADLQKEIGIPDTQINIVAITALSYSNWTEIRFTVSLGRPIDSIASLDLRLLKDTFVELFMQRTASLSLTSTVFGRVSHFEVLQFPGGITVIPPQQGSLLSEVLVLFNFTLHDCISHVHGNFAKFCQELANGIVLKPNENLFVQLTNLEGSTVNSPVVVETSILPVVGVILPSPRLKQLAWELTALPERNLGLNNTLFGTVEKIELSFYLKYCLESAETPSPSPSPAPSFPLLSRQVMGDSQRNQGVRNNGQHSNSMAPRAYPDWNRGRHSSRRLAPAPHHSEGFLPPIYPPSQPYLQSQPSISPSIQKHLFPAFNTGLAPHPTMGAPAIIHTAGPSP